MNNRSTKQFGAENVLVKRQSLYPLDAFVLPSTKYRLNRVDCLRLDNMPQNRFWRPSPAEQSLKSGADAFVDFGIVNFGTGHCVKSPAKSHVTNLDSNDGDIKTSIQVNAQANECVAEGARLSKDPPPPPIHQGNRNA